MFHAPSFKRAAQIAAPLLLILISLPQGFDQLIAHGIREPDDWVDHPARIPGRWLGLHLTGFAMSPLIGLAVWWARAQS